MHWPVAFRNPKNSELSALKSQDGRPIENHILSQDLQRTWQNLEEMVKKGKVRNIGISNFNIRRVDYLLSQAEIQPQVNQVEVNWGVPNDELLHYCEAHQVQVQAYSPLGSSDYAEEYAQDPVIADVAKRNNITPAQVQLAWHMARGIQPITRSTRPERLEEALAAQDVDLPWADVQHLLKEAENKPIQRVVDPTEAWNVKEDIFEDGVDQTRLMTLKGGSIDVPFPHETENAPQAPHSGSSHYLEPRNDPSTENKPSETVARFHTIAGAGARANATKGSTVLQQLMNRRAFSSSPRRAASSSSASSSSFLAGTSKQALATPGLTWTDGSKGAASRETRKMNMCSVGGQRFASSIPTHISTVPEHERPTPLPKSQRKYPARKSFLHAQYMRLLESSQFVLVLQPNNLSVAEAAKLRADLAAVPLPEGVDASERARLTVVRTGVLRPALRQLVGSNESQASLARLESILSGPLAMLTSPSLSPDYVSKLLAVVDRAMGNVVGRGAQPAVNPRLVPLAAIVEGNRLVDIPALREVGKLPDLQTLRAQLVGLLSSPASQLASILSMASGAQLALTLEARKRQLGEGETPSQ